MGWTLVLTVYGACVVMDFIGNIRIAHQHRMFQMYKRRTVMAASVIRAIFWLPLDIYGLVIAMIKGEA